MVADFVAQMPMWDQLWQGQYAVQKDGEGKGRKDCSAEELAREALLGWEYDPEIGEEQKRQRCPSATVHNIVSTSILYGSQMPINLQQLADYLPCSSYNRHRFAAITIRIDNPKCTCLLFTSGKLVTTGVKSWYESLLASLCMSRLISDTLVNSSFRILNCVVQNIVGHSEVPLQPQQRLDIQSMYEVSRCSKNPILPLITQSNRCLVGKCNTGHVHALHLQPKHVPGIDIQGARLPRRVAVLLFGKGCVDGGEEHVGH